MNNDTTISQLLSNVRDCHAVMTLSNELGVEHPLALIGAVKLASSLDMVMEHSTPLDFLDDEYEFLETCFEDLRTLSDQISELSEEN